ncbi:MAG TPA: hypothetical protein VGG79_15160 [Roseiarcus sp.]
MLQARAGLERFHTRRRCAKGDEAAAHPPYAPARTPPFRSLSSRPYDLLGDANRLDALRDHHPGRPRDLRAERPLAAGGDFRALTHGLQAFGRDRVGRELKRLVPDLIKRRPTIGSDRAWHYRFPALSACRAAFDEAMQ